MNVVTLEEMFGGSWDGDTEEIHGYVVQNGITLKVEILRQDDHAYMVSVFDGGECVFSESVHEAYEAIARVLHDQK